MQLFSSTPPYCTELLLQATLCAGVPRRVLEVGEEPVLVARLQTAGVQVVRGRAVEMDIVRLPFADRAFDVAVVKGLLEGVPPVLATALLQEVARVTASHLVLWFALGLRTDGCVASYTAPEGGRLWMYPTTWVVETLQREAFGWQGTSLAVLPDAYGLARRYRGDE